MGSMEAAATAVEAATTHAVAMVISRAGPLASGTELFDVITHQ